MNRQNRGLQLTFQADSQVNLNGFWGNLIGLFGLNVYGLSLLSKRAFTEMKFAAILLCIVFLFDLFAWGLLFNAILNTDMFALNVRTLFALVIALLISATVMIYERQYLTADTSTSKTNLGAAMIFRVLVIVASAVITAQPIELLFFKKPIQERVHQEGIILEAVSLFKINRTESQSQNELEATLNVRLSRWTETSSEKNRLKDAENTYQELLNQQLKLSQRADNQEPEIQRLRSSLQTKLNRLEKDRSQRNDIEQEIELLREEEVNIQGELGDLPIGSERRSLAINDYQKLVKKRQARQRELDNKNITFQQMLDQISEERIRIGRRERNKRNTDASVTQMQKNIQSALTAREAASEAYQKALKIEEERIRTEIKGSGEQQTKTQQWIARLSATPPSEETLKERDFKDPEALETELAYTMPQYNFFQKLRVLYDLIGGAPPRWPKGITEETKEAIRTEYTLPDRRDEEDGKSIFFWSWLFIYAIAIVIPLLVIAMKFLMASELKTYYSYEFQAANLQPEAVTFKHIKEVVKQSKSQKRLPTSTKPTGSTDSDRPNSTD